MASKGFTFTEPFNNNDNNWTLSNAQISGGVLDITADTGYGQKSPDANWYSGANNDFIIEVDFKQDATSDRGARVEIKLVGDATFLKFLVFGATNLMILHYGTNQVQQAFNDDTNLHTMKIRRVGTVYYFSIDGGSEINWNYGTERAIEYIQLTMFWNTGDFDNFKYSWTKLSYLLGKIKIISETLNISELKNKLKGLVRTINETLNISELYNRLAGLFKVINEIVNIGEVENYIRNRFKVISETLNISELKNKLRARFKVIGETLNISELKNTIRGFIQVISETINISELKNYLIKVWEKMKRAIASITKLTRDDASMSKLDRDAPSISKEDRDASSMTKETRDNPSWTKEDR